MERRGVFGVEGRRVAAVAVVPGGPGTFEGAGAATLGVFGVPPSTALAAMLLFRGFSFRLPMLPGLSFARRELTRGL